MELFATTKLQQVTQSTLISAPSGDSKSKKVLYPTPGLKKFIQSATLGYVRGLYATTTGRLFAVIADKLNEYTASGAEIVRGTLKTSSGQVSMADCGDSPARGYGICLVDGQYGYNFNLSNNTFEQIVDPTFSAASKVLFLNGYFLVNELASNRVHYSQLYNCLDWGDLNEAWTVKGQIALQSGIITVVLLDSNGNPAINLTNIPGGTYITLTSANAYLQGTAVSFDTTTGTLIINVTSFNGSAGASVWSCNVFTGSARFFTKEGSSDYLKTMASIHGELWLIGDQSIEVWYNPNGADDTAPFMRVRGAFMNNGTVAPYSACNNGSNLFWLGSSVAGHGRVWMSSGYQPQAISTNSIDHIIERQ